MVQNVTLRSGNKQLVIASNNTSEFVKWIADKFSKSAELSSSTVVGIMNVFDRTEHEGVIFRSDLLEFLWESRGRNLVCNIA